MTDELQAALRKLNDTRKLVESARIEKEKLITQEIKDAEDKLRAVQAEEAKWIDTVRALGVKLYPNGTSKDEIPGIQVVMKEYIDFPDKEAIDYCQTEFKAAIETTINKKLFVEYIKSLVKAGTLKDKLKFVRYEEKPFTNIARDLSFLDAESMVGSEHIINALHKQENIMAKARFYEEILKDTINNVTDQP